MRDTLSKDPFMKQCCVNDSECSGHIEWNHALKYQGERQNILWGIVPMCVYHHSVTDRKDIRAKVVAIMRERGGEEVKQFEKISPLR